MPPALAASCAKSDGELNAQSLLVEIQASRHRGDPDRYAQDRARYIMLTETHPGTGAQFAGFYGHRRVVSRPGSCCGNDHLLPFLPVSPWLIRPVFRGAPAIAPMLVQIIQLKKVTLVFLAAMSAALCRSVVFRGDVFFLQPGRSRKQFLTFALGRIDLE